MLKVCQDHLFFYFTLDKLLGHKIKFCQFCVCPFSVCQLASSKTNACLFLHWKICLSALSLTFSSAPTFASPFLLLRLLQHNDRKQSDLNQSYSRDSRILVYLTIANIANLSSIPNTLYGSPISARIDF